MDAKRRRLSTPVSHSQVAHPTLRSKAEYLSHTNDEDDCGITTPKGHKRRGAIFAAQSSCFVKLLWEVTSSDFEWERERILHPGYFENVFLSIWENVFSVCIPSKN